MISDNKFFALLKKSISKSENDLDLKIQFDDCEYFITTYDTKIRISLNLETQ